MRMNRILIIIFSLFTLSLCAMATMSQQKENRKTLGARDEKTVAAVRAVLDAQVAAWNRGDIAAFMDGYARSSETVFVSGDNVTRGWQTVLDRYKKSYDSREKMGQLAFTDLEITPLGADAALALGRWQLVRAADTPHGRFTLIFRRTRDGWRIIHDHTSSATP